MDKSKDKNETKDMIVEEYLLGKNYYEEVEKKQEKDNNKNAT